MIISSNDSEISLQVTSAVSHMMNSRDDKIFSYLIFNIPIKIDVDDNKENKIYTNGIGIVFEGNKNNLKKEINEFGSQEVLKHEMMHIIFKHIERSENFVKMHNEYPPKYLMDVLNYAEDYIINTELGKRNSQKFVCEKTLLDLGLTP
ncbi:MAG: hypothetical protein ACP5IV_07880, partial [Caldisericia bacterium]